MSTDSFSSNVNDSSVTNGSDEVCSSDLRNVCSSASLQKEIRDLFKETKKTVSEKKFAAEIMPYLPNVEDLKETLYQSINDLERIDCPIVFAGETSSGKSSIINAILSEKILPTGVTATTTRVCRVKHSEKMMIITLDVNYKILEKKNFSNIPEMAADLKMLAQTNNPAIGYVDILTPVLPFQQENLAVVDTPGIGDSRQKEVAKKMMKYLPNALAFVFVINVPAAGGLQEDRFARILAHVNKSQKEMVSFSRSDVIFLLNKWDALLKDDDKEDFFERSKSQIRNLWPGVDNIRVLKISMNEDFKERLTMFEEFMDHLKEVIDINKEKRIKRHMSFLESFLNDCSHVVLIMLRRAKRDAKHSRNKLDAFLLKILDLKRIKDKESLDVEVNVNRFLHEVTIRFYRYISDPTFHAIILKNVEKSWRLKIKYDIDTRIEIETKHWEKKNIRQIFQEIIVKTLDKKLRRICETETEDLLKGFRVPIDLDESKSFGTFRRALSLAGCTLLLGIVRPDVACAAAATMVVTGAVKFGFPLKDFKEECQNALKKRIGYLTEHNIRKALDDRYANAIRSNIEKALKTMETNIKRMQDVIVKKQSKHTVDNSKLDTVLSLETKISDLKERFQNIKEKMLKNP